jgi:uroporphyrinogen decarboxylase
MDLSAEAEAFGCQVMFSDAEPPTVTGRLVTDAAAAKALRVPAVGAARTGVYLETVSRLKALPGRPKVLAGIIGPFSLAGRLFGVSESLSLTLEDPGLMHLLLRKSTEFLLAYARAFMAAGADGVVMAEPTAGLLSPRSLGEFSSPYIKQLAQAFAGEDFTLVLHNCAAKLLHLKPILESGATVLHFGAPMDLPAALAQVDPGIVVCGNLDPTQVLLQASPPGVSEAVAELVVRVGDRSNFVLSTGCDVPARTPIENLDAFFHQAAQRRG